MNNLVIIALFIFASAFTSVTQAKEKEPDCDAALLQVKEARSEFKEDYKQQKKAFKNWDKYYKELHSMTYEATDQPLAVSAQKCKDGDDSLGKDFCKGAVSKYDEISAKEAPAKAELDAAKKKAEKSKLIYNHAVRNATDMGCSMSKVK